MGREPLSYVKTNMAQINESFVDNENKSLNGQNNNLTDNSKDADSVEIEMNSNGIQVKSIPDEPSPKLYSGNIVAAALDRFWEKVNEYCLTNGSSIKKGSLLCVVALIVLYIGTAIRQFQLKGEEIVNWCEGYGLAIVLSILFAWAVLYYTLIAPYVFSYLQECSCLRFLTTAWRKLRTAIAVLLIFALVGFIVWDTSHERRRLLSFCCLLTFIAVGFIFSKYPSYVRWRTILIGLLIQFTMGMISIRWDMGRQLFKCLGHLAETFLEYSYVGATMVFGERIVREDHVFAFQALSAIFFVSMIVEVLFHIGLMQVFCLKLGWLLQSTMGTTIMESVNAVSSVFLGMTEAPMLYRPYLKDLTPSEIYAVMVGGFSTIAGTVFAAYTSFGVDPANIITASLMAAPSALYYAKLTFPETMPSKTDVKNVQIYKSDHKSVMDAAIQGAMLGVNIVQGIIASVIACVSVVAFLNAVIGWLGFLVGISNLSLEMILSYLLLPIVWLMGVQPSQCYDVARLIGIKISFNEFVAYREFGELKKAGVLSVRSEAMATFALCSFANPCALGIFISTLTALCPSQRTNIITLSIRALVCSTMVTFMTACVAGTVMPEEGFLD